MQVNLPRMRFYLLYSLVAAAILLAVPSGSSPAIAAGDGEAFIVLLGEAPRYGGQQGREADITELLATAKQTGGVLGIFRQTIAPNRDHAPRGVFFAGLAAGHAPTIRPAGSV